MNDEKWKFDTQSIHVGEPRPAIGGAVSLPIFQSSTFEYSGPQDELRYIRLNNTPNHKAINEKIAALEKAEAGVVLASGMAAITTALLALTGEGDHVLAQETLYGGTYQFLKEDFPKLGRRISYFKISETDTIEKNILPMTKVLYVESLSNPLLEVPDLEKIVEIAKRRNIITVIDNTFPSPVNFNPISLGFDVVVHSATKYLNGHTDIIAGCVVGSKETIEKVNKLSKMLGGSLDPHACFLLSRGMKTLGVRVRHQNASALLLAKALASHPKVKKVSYPGLETHPDHQKARRWFKGFGGMLSFEIKGSVADTQAFLKRLKIAYLAPSLGGVETLVTLPATTSHNYMSPEDREKIGVTDTLIRVSVGLEDPEDLKDDFLGSLG